jgi:16S rRNA G1207 methylase RsmC
MDAIRSSLLMDLLTQQQGTEIEDVVAGVGAIGAG